MALVTANDVAVLNGSIMMPLNGIWTADIVVDQTEVDGFEAGDSVTIASQDGFSFVGTVAPFRAGEFIDSVHVRILGGAGGMSSPVRPQSFVQPSAYVRDVLNALASDSGETLSSTISSSFTQSNLVAWAITAGPVSSALNVLLDIVAPTFGWRMLADGTLWMGVETWPESSAEHTILDHNPIEGTYMLGADSPLITPGVSLPVIGNINRVEHQLGQGMVRSKVWTESNADRGILPSVRAIVAQAIAPIDYYSFYSGTIRKQSSDLTTVDIEPDNAALLGPGFQRVPLRHGLPGCKVQISNGSKIRIGWDDGNPQKPFAAIWNGEETVQKVQIGGTTKVARDGDDVSKSTPMGVWMDAVTSATAVPPLVGNVIGLISEGSDILRTG